MTKAMSWRLVKIACGIAVVSGVILLFFATSQVAEASSYADSVVEVAM